MSKKIHYCSVCGQPYGVEKHHIVFRSEAKYMEHIALDFKYLCFEHHKGNNGPHKNRKVDIKYKLELQDKLFNILPKDYYRIEELKKAIECSEQQARAICKTLIMYKGGYSKVEIVRRMMGGKLYSEDDLKKLA